MSVHHVLLLTPVVVKRQCPKGKLRPIVIEDKLGVHTFEAYLRSQGTPNPPSIFTTLTHLPPLLTCYSLFLNNQLLYKICSVLIKKNNATILSHLYTSNLLCQFSVCFPQTFCLTFQSIYHNSTNVENVCIVFYFYNSTM